MNKMNNKLEDALIEKLGYTLKTENLSPEEEL